jgi:hypothetical protein
VWRNLLFIAVLMSCGYARAQEACPWLTQGTAAALMGGAASMSVHTVSGEGNCEFRLNAADSHVKRNKAEGQLMRIVVSHQPHKQCAAGERLTGIGEDSVLCVSDTKTEYHATVFGRVRTVYFSVALTARGVEANDKVELRSSLQQAAEEVAGNLF